MPRDRAREIVGAGFVARWQRRTMALFRAPALERDMAEEMRLHVELEAEELARTRGLSASDAMHQALLRHGARIVSGERARPDLLLIDGGAGQVDAAIVGLGTCGSCTTFTIKDAVTVEEHEKPVVAIVCEEFTVHAHNVARHVGHSDMNVLVLPYPLEARAAEELQQIAHEYYPKVLALLGVTQ